MNTSITEISIVGLTLAAIPTLWAAGVKILGWLAPRFETFLRSLQQSNEKCADAVEVLAESSKAQTASLIRIESLSVQHREQGDRVEDAMRQLCHAAGEIKTCLADDSCRANVLQHLDKASKILEKRKATQ